jgi:hypothetical protein
MRDEGRVYPQRNRLFRGLRIPRPASRIPRKAGKNCHKKAETNPVPTP